MSLRLYSTASLGLGPAFLRVASLRLPSYAQSQGMHQLACSSSVAELRHVDSASLLRGHRTSSPTPLSCHSLLSSRSKSYRKSGTQRKPGALWSGPVSIAMGLAGFGLFDKGREEVHCESSPVSTSRPTSPANDAPPPPSPNKEPLLNVANLSFGTIAGLCSGVFVKKGLKLLAVLLGAAFLLLQYLSTQHLVSVNWSGIASRYEHAADKAAQQTGNENAPTSWQNSRLARIWGRFINFMTTGFQWKASFIAGFTAGFRYG